MTRKPPAPIIFGGKGVGGLIFLCSKKFIPLPPLFEKCTTQEENAEFFRYLKSYRAEIFGLILSKSRLCSLILNMSLCFQLGFKLLHFRAWLQIW